MVMDQSLRGLYGSVNKLKINNESRPPLPDNSRLNQNYARVPPLPPNLSVPSAVGVGVNQVDCSNEDFDFSDVALKYISEMLMEEDMEEKACMYQESSAALQAAEKSLYELIGQQYPPSVNYRTGLHFDQNQESSDEISDQNNEVSATRSISQFTFSATRSHAAESAANYEVSENRSSGYALQSTSQSSFSSGSSAGTVGDGFVDSPVSILRIPDIFGDSDSVMQFKKGFEEASRFIPNGSLFVDLESNNFSARNQKEAAMDVVAKEEVKVEHSNGSFFNESRGKKNSHPEDYGIEGGRSRKQSALFTESDLSSADFDMVLLSCAGTDALRVELQNEKNKDAQQVGQIKGSTGGKARGKKQGGKRNVVDLRTLLTLCAQAVGADDRRTANDLLKQIRQNALPTGDGMQRLANVFADGLEARLAGSGTQIYKALLTKPTSAADILKAYHLFLAACPFKKLTDFFSNKTIMNISENATKLHIVDFGIMYGFQWPCLIRRLSSRPRPPMLRITGIDLPNPGFRPAERVEETGQRLANYAKRFNVPFQFHAIAQKWDTIKIEDLKFDEDEVLVVNCEYRLRSLLDETVVVESPRNIVLNLIRKMNPDVFILGIVNGSYSAPFFITRFREALFHYSTLFDMLETTVPREIPERMLIEREIFGREAMNVIACEGAERIERPETYKQWQVRIQRAGFRQLPLNEEIFAEANGKVKALYHKDFVIDEDSQWLLQGWKGRIVYALSSWKPYR